MEKRKMFGNQTAVKDIENRAKWGYNSFFLDTIIPALDFMINEGQSGVNGMTFDQWRKILQEMKEGFELLEKNMIKCGGWSFLKKFSKKDKLKIDVSFSLFKKHFFDLWD